MNTLLIVGLLICLSLGDRDQDRTVQLNIDSVTKMNAESSKRIIIGNQEGKLYIYNKKTGAVQQIKQVHQNEIVEIQKFQLNQGAQYVTVDESGLIVIWNDEMTQVKLMDTSLAKLLTSKITSTAVKESGHKIKNKDYMLALTTQTEVYEYCLNKKMVHRKITMPASVNFNYYNQINSIAYIGTQIFAALTNTGIFVADENDEAFRFLAGVVGSIENLITHEQDSSAIADGIGVFNRTSIIHFNRMGISKQNIQFTGQYPITSLNQCYSRQKRQKQDLIVVGFEDGTLLIRSSYKTFERQKSDKQIVEIECDEDEVYFIDSQSNLFLFQLDHLQHSHVRFSGIAALLLGGIVLLIVVCIVWKRRKLQKIDQSIQTNATIELQDRTGYEPPVYHRQTLE